MAGIRDVAKLANVSPATVSRVINGTARVDEEKEARVLRAISETGFVPNEVARTLFKKSSKMIGLIVPSIENPFFTQLANVIEKVAERNGYRILLCSTGSDYKREKSIIQMLMSMNADGIIITTSNPKTKPLIDKCNIPVVITDRCMEKVMSSDYVHCDHYQGSRLAMEHLVTCGCRNIVCMRASLEISSASSRYEGYKDMCRELGMQERVIECGYDFQEGLEKAEELLRKYPDTDGIIASNDMVAVSLYKVLQRKGISVPEQIQIIGFDNINLASLLTPELTTIAQPVEEIGTKAAELIIEYQQGVQEKKEYVFQAKLIKRETTKQKK